MCMCTITIHSLQMTPAVPAVPTGALTQHLNELLQKAFPFFHVISSKLQPSFKVVCVPHILSQKMRSLKNHWNRRLPLYACSLQVDVNF